MPAQRGEPVRRARDLARRVGVGELARVGPHQQRQPLALLIAGRQVQRAGQLHAVLALRR